MWYSHPSQQVPIIDFNAEIAKLAGELSDEQAKVALAKFLYRNLGFTTEWLTGKKLYPDQIINLKGLMYSDYSLCVWGRGLGKTFMAAIFSVLLCIFKPDTNILIAGPTFRTARFIFNYIEKLVESPEAKLLAACMHAKPSKRNDEFIWKINGGRIIAIPLNGEKIRGFRANVLIIDEFLLMPEELVERVLIPYLIVPPDMTKMQRLREREEDLIKRGLMTEEQREKPDSSSKLVGLSSASYTCEYLYRKFSDYISKIREPKPGEKGELPPKYFISQMSWDSIPPKTISERMDKKIITMAAGNEAHAASFKREYGAQFVDGSDGYFSMNKMIECTVKDGHEPTQLLKGSKDKRYLLAIDPNLSNSETADHFAMCVLELDQDKEGKFNGLIVHSYAKAGKDLKDHILYFHYLLTYFNIEIIIIDNAGYQFIDAANESQCLRDSGINIKIFDFDAKKDGDEYKEELRNAKKNYNRTIQKIAFTQVFEPDFIQKSNEWLQGCINYKRVLFSSPISSVDSAFETAVRIPINSNLSDVKLDEGESFMGYFIENQKTLMEQTKRECAAIEVKISIRGIQSFDLPDIIKRDNTPTRMRRDSYTALLLACWGMRCYQDILNTPVEQYETFAPFAI